MKEADSEEWIDKGPFDDMLAVASGTEEEKEAQVVRVMNYMWEGRATYEFRSLSED